MTIKFSTQQATRYIQDDQHEIKIVCQGEGLVAEVHEGGMDKIRTW